jgi:FtsP/CotA-like multicopper oxidase with cupredoxin domain
VVAQRNVPTTIEYINALTPPLFLQNYEGGMFKVDQTLNWADPFNEGSLFTPYSGPVPVCVHLHGGSVPSAFDGGPDQWFTPNVAGYTPITGPGYVSNIYTYPNDQEAATIWFHDHALGITRLTPHAGLAAFYLVKDPANEPLNLPAGVYDQEIAIQDRLFDTNGQLIFPDDVPNPDVHPMWEPEFFGDTIVVNGKAWPYYEVEPRRYRLRLLNGSNARVYDMAFNDPKVKMWQIATENGYLDTPVELKNLVMAPGERVEIVVDFSRANKSQVTLTNTGRSPYPFGSGVDRRTTGQILQFRVTKEMSGPDLSCSPALNNCVLRPNGKMVQLKPKGNQVPTRRLTLNEEIGPGGPLEMMMNNSKLRKLGDAGAITETPRVGSTEIWELINLTADTHPIHTHLASFQVLERQTLQAARYNTTYDATFPGGFNPGDGQTYLPGVYMPGFGPPLPYGVCGAGLVCGGNPDPAPYLVGSPFLPYAYEAGWKDTVQANPGEVTRIAVRWAPTDKTVAEVQPGMNFFPFDPTAPLGSIDAFGYPGGPGYVWHCHIIDHEDNEMMRRYEVAP